MEAFSSFMRCSQLNAGKGNDGDPAPPQTARAIFAFVPLFHGNNVSCQSDGRARQWEEHRGRVGLKMWEGGRGMTGPQLSAPCTYIWLSVLAALC